MISSTFRRSAALASVRRDGGAARSSLTAFTAALSCRLRLTEIAARLTLSDGELGNVSERSPVAARGELFAVANVEAMSYALTRHSSALASFEGELRSATTTRESTDAKDSAAILSI